MTPDAPKDRLQAMRIAYERMVKDPDFLATAEKARIEVAPVFGDKLQVIIDNVLASSATVKATAKTIIQ